MLQIKNISKSINGNNLFENISFKLSENQKVGFVGPNGTGKTTFLKIIVGLTDPDSGTINKSGEKIGYLAQKIDADTTMLVYEYLFQFLKNEWEEYQINVSLAKVGLGKIDPSLPISKLSGGQKMKLGLAKILLKDPTILLLDEPTNNLDMQSLLWLEKFVNNFEGKILVISHDRTFLDNCVNKIIELDPFNKSINEFGGNYSNYIKEKAEKQANKLSSYKIQQKKEQQMTDWIRKKQEQLKYHPNNKVASQLQAMKTRMDREIKENKIDKPQSYQSFSVNQIANGLHRKKTVFSITNFSIPNLINCYELYIFANDRINFSGKNGSGKTTFIKSLKGLNLNFSGNIEIGSDIKIGYFSQEHELLNKNKSVIDNFIESSLIKSESKARNILGNYLFSASKVFSLASLLSEGEKARLILAILISQNNNFLLLDEPTNHLDLESRDILEKALQNYNGGFIVVSHDRFFLKNIGINKEIVIKNKKIIEIKN